MGDFILMLYKSQKVAFATFCNF